MEVGERYIDEIWKIHELFMKIHFYSWKYMENWWNKKILKGIHENSFLFMKILWKIHEIRNIFMYGGQRQNMNFHERWKFMLFSNIFRVANKFPLFIGKNSHVMYAMCKNTPFLLVEKKCSRCVKWSRDVRDV